MKIRRLGWRSAIGRIQAGNASSTQPVPTRGPGHHIRGGRVADGSVPAPTFVGADVAHSAIRGTTRPFSHCVEVFGITLPATMNQFFELAVLEFFLQEVINETNSPCVRGPGFGCNLAGLPIGNRVDYPRFR